MTQKQVLLVTRVFPPKGGGGVQRMVKFATYLRDHNWLATVVAPNTSDAGWQDQSQLKLVGAQDVVHIGTYGQRTNLLHRVIRRVSPVDAFRSWATQVTRSLTPQVLDGKQIVFTSGPPHSTHLVGYWLSKKHDLHWVADFRDHYTLSPEYRPVSRWHRRYDERFEETILQTATKVICNTRTNRRDLIARFGTRFAHKIVTIYNGFDRRDLQTDGSPVKWSGERRNYLYLGGLRGGHIDDSFLRVLALLEDQDAARAKKIVLRVVGDSSRKSPLMDELVERGIVTLQAPVASDSLGNLLEAADGCISWQRDNPNYAGTIGGKIFDYIASEKPVFSLGQPGGEIDRMLRRFQLGVNASPADPRLALAAFIEFDTKVEQGAYSQPAFDRRVCLDKYSRQHQAHQLAQVFDSIARA